MNELQFENILDFGDDETVVHRAEVEGAAVMIYTDGRPDAPLVVLGYAQLEAMLAALDAVLDEAMKDAGWDRDCEFYDHPAPPGDYWTISRTAACKHWLQTGEAAGLGHPAVENIG